jgi:hypothetical protein
VCGVLRISFEGTEEGMISRQKEPVRFPNRENEQLF